MDTEQAIDEDPDVFQITLTSLKSQALPILEKCRLFILFLHRVQVGYLDKNDPEPRRVLCERLSSLFERDISLKKAFVHFSLMLIISTFPNWRNNLLGLFDATMMEHFHANHKLSEVQYRLSF